MQKVREGKKEYCELGVKEGFLEEVTVKLRANDEQALFKCHVTNFHFYRGL